MNREPRQHAASRGSDHFERSVAGDERPSARHSLLAASHFQTTLRKLSHCPANRLSSSNSKVKARVGCARSAARTGCRPLSFEALGITCAARLPSQHLSSQRRFEISESQGKSRNFSFFVSQTKTHNVREASIRVSHDARCRSLCNVSQVSPRATFTKEAAKTTPF